MQALSKLDAVMGGSADAFRAICPGARGYTHGRPEQKNQRRIDAWRVQSSQLAGQAASWRHAP